MTLHVRILRSGVIAEQFCRDVSHAKVEAVFERCFYLRRGDDFICVGEPDIGNGPLTAIADLSGRRVMIGDAIRLVLDRSEQWRAPQWPVCASTDRLIETTSALARRVAIGAPEEGLARVVHGSHQTPLARIARPRISAFENWLSGICGSGPASDTAVQNLIGLGPGLTPSGDDFLTGVLALIDAIADRETHVVLARAIIDAPLGLTTPLSACFLRAAAAGHVGEALHRIVSSVITGDADAAVAAADKIGHSSGWDMLAGVVTAVRIAAAARLETTA